MYGSELSGLFLMKCSTLLAQWPSEATHDQTFFFHEAVLENQAANPLKTELIKHRPICVSAPHTVEARDVNVCTGTRTEYYSLAQRLKEGGIRPTQCARLTPSLLIWHLKFIKIKQRFLPIFFTVCVGTGSKVYSFSRQDRFITMQWILVFSSFFL